MCINKENKPWTCCCGCTLLCGVFTISILEIIGAIGSLIAGGVLAFIVNLVFVAPYIALLICRDNPTVR